MKVILGKKLTMSQVFADDGKLNPCTILSINDSYLVSRKTTERDGYEASVIALGDKKKNPNKADAGKYSELGFVPTFAKEVKNAENINSELNVGDKLGFDWLDEIKSVSVVANTKGKGFLGVIRGHKMKGGPKTHGQSNKHRSIGSIAPGQTFAHVMKGRRMARRFGNDKVTLKGLKVLKVDKENGYLYLKGSVPGFKGAKVMIIG